MTVLRATPQSRSARWSSSSPATARAVRVRPEPDAPPVGTLPGAARAPGAGCARRLVLRAERVVARRAQRQPARRAGGHGPGDPVPEGAAGVQPGALAALVSRSTSGSTSLAAAQVPGCSPGGGLAAGRHAPGWPARPVTWLRWTVAAAVGAAGLALAVVRRAGAARTAGSRTPSLRACTDRRRRLQPALLRGGARRRSAPAMLRGRRLAGRALAIAIGLLSVGHVACRCRRCWPPAWSRPRRWLAYIPLTHMSHFVGKYFTYHAVRWDDAPLGDRPEDAGCAGGLPRTPADLGRRTTCRRTAHADVGRRRHDESHRRGRTMTRRTGFSDLSRRDPGAARSASNRARCRRCPSSPGAAPGRSSARRRGVGCRPATPWTARACSRSRIRRRRRKRTPWFARSCPGWRSSSRARTTGRSCSRCSSAWSTAPTARRARRRATSSSRPAREELYRPTFRSEIVPAALLRARQGRRPGLGLAARPGRAELAARGAPGGAGLPVQPVPPVRADVPDRRRQRPHRPRDPQAVQPGAGHRAEGAARRRVDAAARPARPPG